MPKHLHKKLKLLKLEADVEGTINTIRQSITQHFMQYTIKIVY